MRNSRKNNKIRKTSITPDFTPASKGSVLLEMENTRIICAASLDGKVPEHALNRGTGWLTAEYEMMPYSTQRRSKRPLIKKDGRSVEIQRLIGRTLRGAVNLSKMQDVSLCVDCDVIQADGGTRTASITGGYIALRRAINSLLNENILNEDPLVTQVAAVSLGRVDGEILLDLDYSEDSRAEVDLNIVMDGQYNILEIQGTGEKTAFSTKELIEMVALAQNGIEELFALQKKYI